MYGRSACCLSRPDPCGSTLSVLHARPSVNALPLFGRDGENKSMCLYNMSKPWSHNGGSSSPKTSHWNIRFSPLISSYVAFQPYQHPSFPGIAHSTENGLINHTVGEKTQQRRRLDYMKTGCFCVFIDCVLNGVLACYFLNAVQYIMLAAYYFRIIEQIKLLYWHLN